MSFYTNLRNTASRIIRDKGTSVTASRETGEYDPVDGEYVTSTQNFSAHAVLLDYRLSDFDGQAIVQGDRRLLIEANTWEPKASDKVTLDGDTWTIVEASPLKPATTTVLYQAQVRK